MIGMNRTYTPELAPEVLDRLDAYAAVFRDDFNRPRQAPWCGVYLQGLIHDGDRKSIEPLSARVTLPPGLDVKDPEQALQQFVNQSPWDEQAVWKRYRATMAETFASPEGIFVIDDTSFPKQGKHSVGVQRQYCGALGKKANCQVAPSVHYVSPEGPLPAGDAAVPARVLARRHGAAGQGGRARGRAPPAMTKGQIALELLDPVRGEGLPGRLVVADAGYGVSGPFRDGLAAAGPAVHRRRDRRDGRLHRGADVGRPGPARPAGTGGRPRKRPRLAEGTPRPVSLKELAAQTPLRKVTWREGTKGKLSGRFAWLRVWPGGGWATGECAGAEPIWLLIEEQADGKLKYAFSNLPAGHEPDAGGPAVEEPLAGGAGLSADEGGTGPGPFRGPLVAGLPPPRLPGDAGLSGSWRWSELRAKRDPARPGKKGVPSR